MTQGKYRVLLVEDDPLIARTLQLSLPYKGFEITACAGYRKGLEMFLGGSFDLALLDVNLPDGNGVELCRRMRETGATLPILMVTARVDEQSAVQGLQGGADDYIRKPFGVEELAARMLRLLNRTKRQSSELSFGSVRLDPEKRRVFVGEKELNLGKREFEILSLLIRKAGNAVTREDILNSLNEESGIYDRTIDSHLSHLRRKLRDGGADDIQIQPLYGVGYRLTEK